jgi:hypothetical protein
MRENIDRELCNTYATPELPLLHKWIVTYADIAKEQRN